MTAIRATRGRTGVRPLPPPPLSGFDHVRRFYDPGRRRVAAKILPGEFYVTTADELVTTVLGSCVTACIWDPVAGVGGMNHFMIPGLDHRDDRAVSRSHGAARYGIFAMEYLINAILTNGGDRSRLQVKLVGGGNVVQCMTSIGAANIAFARDYLDAERLSLVGEHVGGERPRKVLFHPLTGWARVMEIQAPTDTVVRREREYADHLTHATDPGGIELFWEGD